MNIINFLQQRTKVGLYYNIEKLDGFLDELAQFFTDEIGGGSGDSWIDFLQNMRYEEMSGNLIALKKKGNYVYISNLYDEESENKYAGLKISIARFTKLINAWEKLMKEQPKVIRLTYSNGEFELSGRGFPTKKANLKPSSPSRSIHDSGGYPDVWRQKEAGLSMDKIEQRIYASIDEAYEEAMMHGRPAKFLHNSNEYIIYGYTHDGIRLQIIFDEDANIRAMFPLYLKKERAQWIQ